MNKLEKLRERAGIVFKKSFGCQDAEKNIHLADKDQFFEKIIERLDKMGYIPDKDFTFDVIRYKFPYAERHHIGQTYEWKYFYSTTFEITDDIIEFLLYHKFIKVIKGKEANKRGRQAEREARKAKLWTDVIEMNEKKIKKFSTEEQRYRNNGQIESADNFARAIEKCQKKIENVKKTIELEEMAKQKNEND